MKKKDKTILELKVNKNYSLKDWSKVNGPYIFSRQAKLAFSNHTNINKKHNANKGEIEKNNIENNQDTNQEHIPINSGWSLLIQEF